ALVLFTSGTLTARSFASKGHYEIDVDRELAAYGAANIASALLQGFAVTGADSRTAMGAAAGGRTQGTGLVAAAAIATVLLFLTEPLRYVPIAALGTVLVFAAISLFDVKTLSEIWKIDRLEFGLAMITTLCVAAFVLAALKAVKWLADVRFGPSGHRNFIRSACQRERPALQERCSLLSGRLSRSAMCSLRPLFQKSTPATANAVLGHDDDQADHTINSYAGIVRNGPNSSASESWRNSLIASGKRPRA